MLWRWCETQLSVTLAAEAAATTTRSPNRRHRAVRICSHSAHRDGSNQPAGPEPTTTQQQQHPCSPDQQGQFSVHLCPHRQHGIACDRSDPLERVAVRVAVRCTGIPAVPHSAVVPVQPVSSQPAPAQPSSTPGAISCTLSAASTISTGRQVEEEEEGQRDRRPG